MHAFNIDYMKYPRIMGDGVEMAEKRALALYEKKGEGRQVYTHDGEVKSQPILVELQNINPGLFSTRGIFSHLSDFAATTCTIDPTDGFGDKVIRGRGERTLYYSVRVTKERLIDLAIDNEKTSYESFWRELTRQGKHNITSAVDFGNGLVMIMPLFRIAPIFVGVEHLHGKTRRDCERLGIKTACIGYEIDFLKELFRACFPGAIGHSGYIKLGKAFYAKFRRTLFEILDSEEERAEMSRFYNPRTGKRIERKDWKTYYKLILYFLLHFSDSTLARSLTLPNDKLITMLAQVDPSQLYENNGKLYLKNIFDTKLFIDKASWIFNKMAKRGFCEDVLAVTEHAIYRKSPEGRGFEVEIFYNKDTSKFRTQAYSSNFIETEIINNEPIADCPF